jgi:hypothetical protein
MNFVVEGRGLTEISLEIRHSFVLQCKKQTGKKRKKKRIMRAMVKTKRRTRGWNGGSIKVVIHHLSFLGRVLVFPLP